MDNAPVTFTDVTWVAPVPAHQRAAYEGAMEMAYGEPGFKMKRKPSFLKQANAILPSSYFGGGGAMLAQVDAPVVEEESKWNTTYWVATNFAHYTVNHWTHRACK